MAGEVSERKRNTFPFALAEGKQDLRPEYLGLSLLLSTQLGIFVLKRAELSKTGEVVCGLRVGSKKGPEKAIAAPRRREEVTTVYMPQEGICQQMVQHVDAG